jgi:hypothetical protein
VRYLRAAVIVASVLLLVDAPALAQAPRPGVPRPDGCGELDGGLEGERAWMACDCWGRHPCTGLAWRGWSCP